MYPQDEYSILPIGKVNLLNGQNAQFGNVFYLWAEGDGTQLLVKQIKYDWKTQTNKVIFRAVITSDSMESSARYYHVGQKLTLVHDQTRAEIGDGYWEVIGLYPHTLPGLLAMHYATGKTSISFSTFK